MRTAIICGGRDFNDWAKLDRELTARLININRVVTGGAPGADTLAYIWARRNGHHVTLEPVDWIKHGRAAGPLRNQLMLDNYNPCLVIAFPGGSGTADMVRRAEVHRIPIIRIP